MNDSDRPYPIYADDSFRWLRYLHYIFGVGLSAVGLLGMIFGSLIFARLPGAVESGHAPPVSGLDMVFGSLIASISLAGTLIGVRSCLSGRCIARFRGRWFSLTVAVLNCFVVPFGTALGLWTLFALTRSSTVYHYRFQMELRK